MQNRVLVYMNSIYMDLSIGEVEKLGTRLHSSSVQLETFPRKQLRDLGNLQRVPETLNKTMVLPEAAPWVTDQWLGKAEHFLPCFICIHCS